MQNAYDLNYLNYYLLNNNTNESESGSTLNKPIGHLNSDHVRIVSACAITGEGLDESLDVLYEMILKNKQKSSNSKSSTSKRFK
jgi:hypothetical protein